MTERQPQDPEHKRPLRPCVRVISSVTLLYVLSDLTVGRQNIVRQTRDVIG